MKLPFCIKKIPNNIVKKNLENKNNRQKVYIKMKQILDDNVFLISDLKEKIDFDYNDIDEVKSTYYESFLKLLYPKNTNLKDKKMEYWNMHTYSNKIINPCKISILKSKILKELIEKNIDFVTENCNFLYEYYNYIY